MRPPGSIGGRIKNPDRTSFPSGCRTQAHLFFPGSSVQGFPARGEVVPPSISQVARRPDLQFFRPRDQEIRPDAEARQGIHHALGEDHGVAQGGGEGGEWGGRRCGGRSGESEESGERVTGEQLRPKVALL